MLKEEEQIALLKLYFRNKRYKRYNILVELFIDDINKTANKNEWFERTVKKYRLKNANIVSFYTAYKRMKKKKIRVTKKEIYSNSRKNEIEFNRYDNIDDTTYKRKTRPQNKFE